MAVTIKDVSKDAAVSIKTVSRVINNEENVAKATKAIQYKVQAPLMPKAIQNPPHHLQCPSRTKVKVQASLPKSIQNPNKPTKHIRKSPNASQNTQELISEQFKTILEIFQNSQKFNIFWVIFRVMNLWFSRAVVNYMS